MKQREVCEKLDKMTREELARELDKAYLDSRKTRLSVEARKSQNSAQAKTERKYIARILTLINSKEE